MTTIETLSWHQWIMRLRESQPTPLQWKVLALLGAAGPICSPLVSEALGVKDGVAWNALEAMRDRGLVRLSCRGWVVTTDASI